MRVAPGRGSTGLSQLQIPPAATVVASALLGALLTYAYLSPNVLPALWAPQHPAPRPHPPAELSEVQLQLLTVGNVPHRKLLKAAFVILIGRAPEELIPTLKRLWVNFLWEFPYEVWVLVPDDVDPEKVQVVKERQDLAMVLPLVRFLGMGDTWQFPPSMVEYMQQPGFNASDIIWKDGFPGYHHMCRFWTMQIFKHPEIGQLDYYCRLDAHSWINSPIKYDLFRFMEVNGFKYGFNSNATDAGYVTVGLWNFTEEYASAHQTNALQNSVTWPAHADRNADGNMPMYYTNFEVVDVAAFRDSAQIEEFNAAVDQSSYIYRFRWGDAPLRWWQVNLFLRTRKDVFQFRSFEYSHPGNVWRIVDFRRKCSCCDCKSGDHSEPPDDTPAEDIKYSPGMWVFDEEVYDYVWKLG